MGRREEGMMERERERYITAGVCVCVRACAHQPPPPHPMLRSPDGLFSLKQGSGSEMKDEGQICNGGRCGDVKRWVFRRII